MKSGWPALIAVIALVGAFVIWGKTSLLLEDVEFQVQPGQVEVCAGCSVTVFATVTGPVGYQLRMFRRTRSAIYLGRSVLGGGLSLYPCFPNEFVWPPADDAFASIDLREVPVDVYSLTVTWEPGRAGPHQRGYMSIKVRPVGFDADEYEQKLCAAPGDAEIDVLVDLHVVPPGPLSILFKGFGDGLSAGFRVKLV